MPRRYDDRDYDRDSQYYRQYNTRPDSESGRGYTPRSDYGRDWESERYGSEGRFPATRIQADIHHAEAASRKVIGAVARITGVAVGRMNATKAIAKAGMAAMVALAPSAATAKD